MPLGIRRLPYTLRRYKKAIVCVRNHFFMVEDELAYVFKYKSRYYLEGLWILDIFCDVSIDSVYMIISFDPDRIRMQTSLKILRLSVGENSLTVTFPISIYDSTNLVSRRMKWLVLWIQLLAHWCPYWAFILEATASLQSFQRKY